MSTFPSAHDLPERQRLDYLHSLGVLDTPPAPWFDTLVRNAAAACQVPAAAITLVAEDRCWFRASVGLVVAQVPRSTSYCNLSFRSSGLFELPDAHADARFRDLPLAQGPDAFRFYAAAPLISARGCSLGTFCVLDHAPRRLDPAQRAALQALAEEAVVLLEDRDRNAAVEEAPAGRAVLIVDDEDLMRHFASEVVRRAGYTPLVAADGRAGLALWQERRDEIAVVLSDQNMPGLTGLELARRLRAEVSPPPVVIMTGNPDARVRAALAAGEFTALVTKPFFIDTLQETLARVAAARR